MPHMNKAKTRGAAQCHDHRVRQTVQTGVPGRKRLIDGISSISVSSAHNGHQSKAIGLAAPYALTQQRPELLCIGHL